MPTIRDARSQIVASGFAGRLLPVTGIVIAAVSLAGGVRLGGGSEGGVRLDAAVGAVGVVLRRIGPTEVLLILVLLAVQAVIVVVALRITHGRRRPDEADENRPRRS